jgi:hypothetical protein
MLVGLLTMLTLIPTLAVAQICRGLASLPSGQLQVTGTGTVASGSKSVGAAVMYGLTNKVIGSVGLGTTSVEALEKSALDLGASLGYRISLGRVGQAELCPTVSTGLQVGPNNTFDSGVDRSTFSAIIGATAGTSVRVGPEVALVPAVGVGLAYRRDKAENQAGANLFRISETYGLAQLHLGIVLKQNVSLRPSMEVPLGLASGDPTFGLTVGYNFGR